MLAVVVSAVRWRSTSGYSCGIAVLYLVLQTSYSSPSSTIVIVDAIRLPWFRVATGRAVIHVVVSHWLFVCTILVALFIALAARRHELVLFADDAASRRPILDGDSCISFDQPIAVVTASMLLIVYIFY